MSLLPDWHSIESTARWSDILFWAGIGCLILLAAAEVASHVYGKRSTELSEAGAHQRMADANQRATTADARAAQAQADTDALRRRQDQRSFTDEQRRVLIAALTPFQGHRVKVI
jgi:hypothetical protein